MKYNGLWRLPYTDMDGWRSYTTGYGISNELLIEIPTFFELKTRLRSRSRGEANACTFSLIEAEARQRLKVEAKRLLAR
jgi:hypothetical protein